MYVDDSPPKSKQIFPAIKMMPNLRFPPLIVSIPAPIQLTYFSIHRNEGG